MSARLLSAGGSAALAFMALSAISASAQSSPAVSGLVLDPLGERVPNAQVELLPASVSANSPLITGQADLSGAYSLPILVSGNYRLRVSAPGVAATVTRPGFFIAGQETHLNLTLTTPTLTEQVTVTASGTPETLAQTAASVTVLAADTFPFSPELQQPLRLVPGVQMTQAGQTGGVTGLFIRGGESDANKVLLDGTPMNDIGGAVNFGTLASVGIAKLEVLREPNSALYGSDALAGVVQFTSTRGTTPLPLLAYQVDGGNYGFLRQEGDLSGALHRFDFFNAFARLSTSNSIANNAFHNATFAGNYGYAPDAKTELRLTVRHLATDGGQPNATALYGIPDAASETEHNLYLNARMDHQTTSRWHNELQYGRERFRSDSNDFSATGIPGTDAFGDQIYLGQTVTITGANGYSATGQAIFQYAGTYPTAFQTSTNRDVVYAQSDYRVNPHLVALGAFRYEAERGYTLYNPFGSFATVDHGNYSETMQISGDVRSRLFYNLGSGLEQHAVYGLAGTPRASVAYYLTRPSSQRFFSGTKLHGSFGKGVKGPSVSQETSSLYDTLASAAVTSPLIGTYSVHRLGAEYSRSYDAGVEQQFGDGRARLNLTGFHNEFTNGVQYVPYAALLTLGVPVAVANSAPYGAYVNSQAFRAFGGEVELEVRLARHLFARGSYTYLDAVVQHSFSSDALYPTFNTASSFSNIPIGLYAPLNGARPFRRAPHTGYFSLDYTRSRFDGHLSGTLVGRRDDSTFLSDPNYLNSLDLPNRNLDGAYQRVELTGSYRINSHLTSYVNMQNLLNEHYFEAFGYPALPFNLRGGIRVSFGGESWKMR